MMLTLMLTSKGLAAVPRTSLVSSRRPSCSSAFRFRGSPSSSAWTRSWIWPGPRSTSLGNCLATVVMARLDGSFELSPDEAPAEPLQEPALAVSTATPSSNLF